MMHFHKPAIFNSVCWERILIVRLSAHGDVVHTLPLLVALKTSFADAKIGWLVQSSAAPLLDDHPFINVLHVCPLSRWQKEIKNPMAWPRMFREIRQFTREIQAEGYQVSLDAQGLIKSAIWPWLANIPKRLGFRSLREKADWFYTHCLPPLAIRSGQTPAVKQYLGLAQALGVSEPLSQFVIPPVRAESANKIAHLLNDLERPDWPLVVLAPFTRWESKHWIPAHWQQLIADMLKLPVRIAIVGSPNDQLAVAAMLAHLDAQGRVLNLAGQTDWPDLYALFKQSWLVIGLDSAPLHIANAVGVPHLLGLYGPTAPGRTGPIGKKADIISTQLSCQPCYEHSCPLKTHDCMYQLAPEMVFARIQALLFTCEGFAL